MKLSEAIAQRQQNQENAFFTNLMQYGMNNDPMFDTSGKNPVYIGGASKIPDKTAVWNQYVQIKGGRLTPQDLAQFEQYYQSLEGAHQSRQLQGLRNLKLRNYSDKKIQRMIKDTPDLYNNLMDMVTKFEARGDEEGMVAANTVRAFMPEENKGMISDEMGIMGQLGMLGAGAAGVGAFKYATGIDHSDVTKARKAFVEEGKSWKSSKLDIEKQMNTQQKSIASKKLQIKSELSQPILKRNDMKVNKLRKELTSLERGLSNMVSEADKLNTQGPSYNPAQSRFQNFKKSYPKVSTGLGGTSSLLGMILAPSIGQALGGDTGERVATGTAGAAIAGSGLSKFAKGVLARRAMAGASNVNPYVQAGLLLTDLGIGGSMLYSALKGE
mgnify:FL=1